MDISFFPADLLYFLYSEIMLKGSSFGVLIMNVDYITSLWKLWSALILVKRSQKGE